MTLTELPNSRKVELEETISSSQTELPSEGIGTPLKLQYLLSTFYPFLLPARCAGVKVAHILQKWSTNDWSKLTPGPWEGAHT